METNQQLEPGSLEATILCEWLKRVQQFHDEILQVRHPKRPIAMTREAVLEETSKVQEEMLELINAQNLTKQADAIIDAIYFLLGAMLRLGLTPEPFFQAVHDANMKKTVAKTQRSETDAIKPEGWQEPNLEKARQHSIDAERGLLVRSAELTRNAEAGKMEVSDKIEVSVWTHDGIMPALLEAAILMSKKAEDYNRSNTTYREYFPYGDKSYAQMIHMKAMRLVNLAEKDEKPNFESVQDSLLDIINYAAMWYSHHEGNQNEFTKEIV